MFAGPNQNALPPLKLAGGQVYGAPTLTARGLAASIAGSKLFLLRNGKVVSTASLPAPSFVAAASSRTHVFVSTTQALLSFEYSATGQRTRMVDASGTNLFAYDSRDRLRTNATPQGSLAYNYDAAGNLTTLKSATSNGTDLAYQFDALGRLTNVVDGRLGGWAASNTVYAFDALGNLSALRYPNGLTNHYAYDPLNRLKETSITGPGRTRRRPSPTTPSGTSSANRTWARTATARARTRSPASLAAGRSRAPSSTTPTAT